MIYYKRFEAEGKYYDRTDPYARGEIAEMVGLEDTSAKAMKDSKEIEAYIDHFCRENSIVNRRKKEQEDAENAGGKG